MLVVVQNIFTSLFNSHLFDFHEGWMYVLGVGVAGGMVLNSRRNRPEPGRSSRLSFGALASPGEMGYQRDQVVCSNWIYSAVR